MTPSRVQEREAGGAADPARISSTRSMASTGRTRPPLEELARALISDAFNGATGEARNQSRRDDRSPALPAFTASLIVSTAPEVPNSQIIPLARFSEHGASGCP